MKQMFLSSDVIFFIVFLSNFLISVRNLLVVLLKSICFEEAYCIGRAKNKKLITNNMLGVFLAEKGFFYCTVMVIS